MDAKIQYNNHIKELAANSESALRRQQIDNDFLTDTITMNIPDELSFKILEYAVEEHDYKDDALWFNGSFSDYRWTISKRVTDGIEGNVARISDRRALHQEQMVRSMQNKLVRRVSFAPTGNLLKGICLGSLVDLQALERVGHRTDVPNHCCQEQGLLSRNFRPLGEQQPKREVGQRIIPLSVFIRPLHESKRRWPALDTTRPPLSKSARGRSPPGQGIAHYAWGKSRIIQCNSRPRYAQILVMVHVYPIHCEHLHARSFFQDVGAFITPHRDLGLPFRRIRGRGFALPAFLRSPFAICRYKILAGLYLVVANA